MAFPPNADRGELLQWLKGFKDFPRQVVISPGEPQSAQALAQMVRDEFGTKVTIPQVGDGYSLD